MYRALLLAAIVALVAAIPAPEVFNCRRPCPRHYDPVCSSDGRTYPNECEFRNGRCRSPGILAKWKGRCDIPSKNVVDGFDPEVAHLNEPDCMTVCIRIFDPVCGSDGQTYSNMCELENAACGHPDDAIVFQSPGVCAPQQSIIQSYNEARTHAQTRREGNSSRCFRPCPRNFRPVCASNNVTYGNQCMFETANCRRDNSLRVVHNGRCT